MGNSSEKIILEYVCPILGTLTANMMFFAPIRDVYRAVRAGKGLGALNPSPWAFMLGNTLGWIAYGLMLQNPFVVLANAPGLLASIWLNLQAVKLQYEAFRSQEMMASIKRAFENATNPVTIMHDSSAKRSSSPLRPVDEENSVTMMTQQDESTTDMPVVLKQEDNSAYDAASGCQDTTIIDIRNANTSTVDTILCELPTQDLVPPSSHDNLVVGNVLLWMIVLNILVFCNVSSDRQEFVVGMITNALNVTFYASPLFTVGTVLRKRNASSIHGPTMLTNTMNGLFWAAYGFAVLDYFIAIPNSLGALLGGIQILLYLVFPRTIENIDEDGAKSKTNSVTAVEAAT